MLAYVEQFHDAIQAAGLNPPEHIADDGKLHRFPSNGKRGDDSGWYALHLDGFPAGVFGDWRTGVSQTWKAETGRKQTKEEAKAQQLVIDGLHKQCKAEEEIGHEAAAKNAAGDWSIATPATEDHDYLKRKGIKPHGVRVLADGRLAVPMHDTAGKVWNLERISPEKPADGSGDKKGLYRGKRTGCYFSIGNPKEEAVICIAEGFATGASIHEATGYPVAVAFNAGNLEPVAKALRRKLPDLPMLICADDDHLTAGNPGRTKAEAAAQAVGAVVVFPVFHGERGDKQTDFNDLHQAEGLEAVQRIVAGAVESIAAAMPEPQPDAENPPADDSVVEQAKPTDAGQPENNPAVDPPIPTIEALSLIHI